jgi:hypothetical protein
MLTVSVEMQNEKDRNNSWCWQCSKSEEFGTGVRNFETNGLTLRKQHELGMENVPIFHPKFQKHKEAQLFSLVDSSSLKWLKEVQMTASHEEPLLNRCLSA